MEIRPARHRQQGTVLIIVLLFLTVLMMMAAAAVTSGVAEERLARASRDYNIGFQAAEAALQDAKNDLIGNGSRNPVIIAAVGFVTNCVNALCVAAPLGCGMKRRWRREDASAGPTNRGRRRMRKTEGGLLKMRAWSSLSFIANLVHR